MFALELGLERDTLQRAILVTALCVLWPSIQIIMLLIFCGIHPKVEKKGFTQSIENTKRYFESLMRSILLTTEAHHHLEIFTKWLLVESVNINNYNKKS